MRLVAVNGRYFILFSQDH